MWRVLSMARWSGRRINGESPDSVYIYVYIVYSICIQMHTSHLRSHRLKISAKTVFQSVCEFEVKDHKWYMLFNWEGMDTWQHPDACFCWTCRPGIIHGDSPPMIRCVFCLCSNLLMLTKESQKLEAPYRPVVKSILAGTIGFPVILWCFPAQIYTK